LYPEEDELEESDEASSRRVRGEGGTSHISTMESSDEAGEAVRRWLELPIS
jgi:hypothetical protein